MFISHCLSKSISYFYTSLECFNGDISCRMYIFLDNFSIIIIT